MKCPVDSVELMMTERSGVEIDYCPQCRGVWLDRGELDKILDRAAGNMPGQPAASPAPAPGLAPPPLYPNFEPRPNPEQRRDQRGYDDRRYGKRDHDRDFDGRRHKKKEGWLGELFDF
ncbi:TFIIB-type zinc ribbon-containing protein [Pseudarthrobacter siccitolerans]|uniref:TFIIB-type zinc ribbon-containing protein n=1 Tax=Pseudarthrobacter siccitolerans TaxID=861266 RepID=UPI000679429D|nr:zf-TFIIB domain-containing protein [Pseudarthrobacter siccitolerans]